MRAVLYLALALGCRAEELCIRLVGQAQPDCWDVESIVSAVTANLTGDREKALALHRFGMAHFIHFNGPIEEREEYVTDPVKLIGVYGYALCGNNSAAMTALYNAAGLRARTRTLPLHAVPEVWFEGKWNYIDTDMFGYVPRPDGKLASVDELAAQPELFLQQTRPPDPYFPFDEKDDMANVFRGVRASKNHHPRPEAHMMNLRLRTGESATLYYRPQGRFLLTTLHPPDIGIVYKDYYVQGPIRRGSLAWCDRPPAAYGNGLIEYKPDLRSRAFQLENPEAAGVAVGRGRQQPELIAATPGRPASVVIEMSTPWVVAGLQNDLTDFDDDTGGAVVSGLFWRTDASAENRILVSTDAGRSWKEVWRNRFLGAAPFQVDLTRHAKGRYAWWVKFEWVDPKGTGRVGLEQLAARTWVALSPMALPRLVRGANRFRLSSAPRRTFYHESRWDRGENLAGQKQRPEGPGVLEFALGPEEDVEEVRVSVLVRALRGIPNVSLALAVSEDGGNSFGELRRFAPEPEHDTSHMWFNHVLRGRLLAGARTRLRLSLAGGGFEKVIANSAVRAAPRAPSALRVVHTWLEGETRRTSVHEFPPGSAPRTYEVEAGPGLRNESIRLEAN